MYVRVVRFTDTSAERLDSLLAEIQQHDGPPEGVTSSGIQFLVDDDQGTAVVLQLFETAEDMASSEKVLDAMDAAETPGTRASVDRCELKLELRA